MPVQHIDHVTGVTMSATQNHWNNASDVKRTVFFDQSNNK